MAREVGTASGCGPGGRNNKNFFDQSLDEIKLLKFLNLQVAPWQPCVCACLRACDYARDCARA